MVRGVHVKQHRMRSSVTRSAGTTRPKVERLRFVYKRSRYTTSGWRLSKKDRLRGGEADCIWMRGWRRARSVALPRKQQSRFRATGRMTDHPRPMNRFSNRPFDRAHRQWYESALVRADRRATRHDAQDRQQHPGLRPHTFVSLALPTQGKMHRAYRILCRDGLFA